MGHGGVIVSAQATITRRLRVADPEGLHARPCAAVAGAMKRFHAEVVLVAGDQQASARSVLEMLQLGVLSSTEIELRATGTDAEQCVAALTQILSARAAK